MVVRLENVSFSFHKKLLLKDANIVCKGGEITTFIGDSTSPIDIIFLLIMGKIEPTFGDIFINGKRFTKRSKRKLKLGYMGKNIDVSFLAQTVREQLSIFSQDEKDDTKIIQILDEVCLDSSYLDRMISTLSKVEKVKIAFASLLLDDNDILLLENPFFLFSSYEKKDMARILKNMKKKKIILFGTSDTSFAQTISDFVYVTAKNKILDSGVPSFILTDKKLLDRARLPMPPILDFIDTVKNVKNVKMIYRSEINDIIKDIYRYVK